MGRPEEESERHSIKLLLFLDSNTGKVLYGSYMSTSGTGQDFRALHYKSVGDFSGKLKTWSGDFVFQEKFMALSGRLTPKGGQWHIVILLMD